MVLLLSLNFNRRQSPFYRYQSIRVLILSNVWLDHPRWIPLAVARRSSLIRFPYLTTPLNRDRRATPSRPLVSDLMSEMGQIPDCRQAIAGGLSLFGHALLVQFGYGIASFLGVRIAVAGGLLNRGCRARGTVWVCARVLGCLCFLF